MQCKQSKTLAQFDDHFAVGSTMSMMIFFLIFKIIQNYSDLSHASSGAANGGKCLESGLIFFLIFKIIPI